MPNDNNRNPDEKYDAAVDAAEAQGLHVLTLERLQSVHHLYVALRVLAQTTDATMRHFANMLKDTVQGMEETAGVPEDIQRMIQAMAVLQELSVAAFNTAVIGLIGAGLEDTRADGRAMHEIEYPTVMCDKLEQLAFFSAQYELEGRGSPCPRCQGNPVKIVEETGEEIYGCDVCWQARDEVDDGDQGGMPHVPGGRF